MKFLLIIVCLVGCATEPDTVYTKQFGNKVRYIHEYGDAAEIHVDLSNNKKIFIEDDIRIVWYYDLNNK